MYCKNCDQSFSDEHVFCNNCGAKLEDIDAATEALLENNTEDNAVADANTEPQPAAEQEAAETRPEPVLQPESQPESQPQPVPKTEPKPENTIPQAVAPEDFKSTAQSTQPVAVSSEPVVDKKQSKTVSFITWLIIIIINIIPFTAGVIYTVGSLVSPFFNLDNITVEGLILPALSLIYVVMLFLWAFGKPKARSLKNYSKATLIMAGIIIVVGFVIFLLLRDYILDIIENLPSIYGEFPF